MERGVLTVPGPGLMDILGPDQDLRTGDSILGLDPRRTEHHLLLIRDCFSKWKGNEIMQTGIGSSQLMMSKPCMADSLI